jgi:carboxypeptidase PM20D1
VTGVQRSGVFLGVTIVLALVLALAGVLFVKALFYSAPSTSIEAVDRVDVPAGAASRLSEAIRIQTISALPDEAVRKARFQAFQAFLEKAYPLVHAALTVEKLNEFGLLYAWKGKNPGLKPILLLSHQDVVPVEEGTEADWTYPPFSGAIEEGFIWGRGAWDDKSTLLASLEALEKMLSEGRQPERTLMLAFGHDEEVGGRQGAGEIAKYLENQGVQFEFVLDEGGVIGKGLVPGVAQPVALIGTAEKGYLTLELSAEGPGGHSSMPPSITAIGRLARAIDRLQSKPFPARLTEPVRGMLDSLGPHMPWQKRLVLANLWLFEPLVVSQMAAGHSTQAHVRTTTAPTILDAGVKENVLPQSASATINFRLLPGETRESAIETVKRAIGDERVAVRETGQIGAEPSAVSSRESYGFKALLTAIRQTNGDVLVSPALLFGATDSRYYAGVTESIFRYTPIRIGKGDVKRIHGTNERIAVPDYENAIRFYYQLLLNTVINPEPSADG